jgi:HAD superfamily hydrolase (TIGR01490 family)
LKAAFFDVDGTLVKGYMILAFPDFLTKKGFFDRKANDRIQSLRRLYSSGKIRYRVLSVKIPGLFAAGIEGQTQSEIEDLATEFTETYSKNIFPYSRKLVSLMNSHGFFTVAVSGSPIEVLKTLEMGFRETQGTEMEVVNGIYTGRVMRNLIISEGKKRVIASIIDRHAFDLRHSFAFGDTEQDLVMLRLVGNPVTLNPNPLLREEALEKGWRIPRDVVREVKEMLRIKA